MPDGLPRAGSAMLPGLRKGRGAVSNPAVRFESMAREALGDGWGTLGDLSDCPPLPATLLRDSAEMACNSSSPDVGLARSLKPCRTSSSGLRTPTWPEFTPWPVMWNHVLMLLDSRASCASNGPAPVLPMA